MKALIAPVAAAAGLVAFVAVFLVEATAFRAAVAGWAAHDLRERTRLAAATLEEPLATGDFAALGAFGAACAADGVRLTVFSVPGGGLVFDSLAAGAAAPEAIYWTEPSGGEHAVRLGLPRARVLAPFHRARLGFLLAALVGGAGVLLVTVVTYRQRARLVEMARLERFRRDFIADVSHEIKTPLTGILGAADLLAETALDATQARLTGLITKESTRLNALAQSILDLARLERADDAPARRETDLPGLVGEVVDGLRERARARGVEIVFTGGPAAPVRCDPRLVAEAVANLVTNAVRHSGAQEVRVTAARARVVVEDRGVGIPPEHAARIFERFYRVDPARAAESGGAGLGLAIVRRIARLHGGEVTFEPVRPHGARFVLTLGEK